MLERFGALIDSCIKRLLAPFVGKYQYTDLFLKRRALSSHAEQLIESAFKNLPAFQIVDYHVHLIGTVTASTGNFIHTDFFSWKHPFYHLVSLAFQSAYGITDIKNADKEALARFLRLANDIKYPSKFCILAFDKYFDENGFFDLIKTKIFVSNNYVFDISKQFSEKLIPCISVHPYREDGCDILEKWARLNVKMVKLLPNSMGINLSHSRCLKFFRKMNELNLILLVHGGDESTIPLVREQKLGNPLLLRLALEEGVKIIVAHCATLGLGEDFDQLKGKKASNFELFLRLVEKREYRDQLFGDLASVTQINRMKYLDRLIELSQPGNILSGRLVNGSDYPLPAINVLISTRALKRAGYLTSLEYKSLNEIYCQNPLLFDFVLKRTIKHPRSGQSFPDEVFLVNKNLNV